MMILDFHSNDPLYPISLKLQKYIHKHTHTHIYINKSFKSESRLLNRRVNYKVPKQVNK